MTTMAMIYWISMAVAALGSIYVTWQDRRQLGAELKLSHLFLCLFLCLFPVVNTVVAVLFLGYMVFFESENIVILKRRDQ